MGSFQASHFPTGPSSGFTFLDMKTKSIYQRQCPELAQIFSQAPAQRILFVALDFARDKHMALCCDGLGGELSKPLVVHNNRKGVDFLNQKIRALCKNRKIDSCHVFIGGEDTPPYAMNFLWALNKDWLTLRVNAHKAKKQRENIKASTDVLDLKGIAKTLLNRDAYRVFETEDTHNDPATSLKILSRNRDALVRDMTRIKNRIHAHVKILFPGFLDAKQDNPIEPFNKVSFELMDSPDFDAGTYARKRVPALAKRLKKSHLKDPEEKAAILIQRAGAALPPPPHLSQSLKVALQSAIQVCHTIQSAIKVLEHQLAKLLARSPAAMLTTMQGMGLVCSSALAGELGPLVSIGSLAQMSSYGGVIPRVQQTGGPDKSALVSSPGHVCNHHLKNHLLRAATSMGTLNGHNEIKVDYQRLKEEGRSAAFIHARRLLSIVKGLMRNGSSWLPEHLRDGVDLQNGGQYQFRQDLYEYLLEAWPKINGKWSDYKALAEAFAEDAPLGQWREVIEQIYRIELPFGAPPILKEEFAED